MIKSIESIIACVLISSACMCSAQDGAPELRSGMNFNEVLRVRGAPIDKDEHEVSRISLWKYKDETLKFFDGKLQLELRKPMIDEISASSLKQLHPSYGVRPKSLNNKAGLPQKTVDEIIDALPNDTGTSNQPQAAQGVPQNQPFVPTEE